MPQARIISPTARISPKIKVERLFTTVSGSSSAKAVTAKQNIVAISVEKNIVAFATAFDFLVSGEVLTSSLFFVLNLIALSY